MSNSNSEVTKTLLTISIPIIFVGGIYSFDNYPFISGLLMGLSFLLLFIRISLTKQFNSFINMSQSNTLYNSGLKHIVEQNYFSAMFCFHDSLKIKYEPITQTYYAWSLEKIGRINEGLWIYNQNCFEAFNNHSEYKTKINLLSYIAIEYGRAILRNPEYSKEHNPLIWIDSILKKSQEHKNDLTDKLKLTKAYLEYLNANYVLANQLFSDLSKNSLDENIKAASTSMVEVANISSNIGRLTDLLGIDNLDKAMQIVSDLYKTKN